MTIAEIQAETCKIWGISTDQLTAGRFVEFWEPRRAAVLACVEIFGYPLAEVERAFGISAGYATKIRLHKRVPGFIDRIRTDKLRKCCEQHKKQIAESMAG